MDLGPSCAYTSRPRILVVSRRHIRKNKSVDFVGEYHLDLILQNGAVPIIVPRVALTRGILEAYEPMHGLLVVEGEDIDIMVAEKLGYRVYEQDAHPDPEVAAKMKELHPADVDHDPSKDELEFALCRRTIEKGIPYLGLCRGGQMLNVVLGGTLYADVELEAGGMKHIDYDNYDGYRHPIRVLPGTPLERWFGEEDALMVNSYHHQGVRRLGNGLKPMAFSPDGLIEGFYDPSQKFRIGLQFHPERMLDEHPGGYRLYEAFVAAAREYHEKQMRRQLQALARIHASPTRPLDDDERLRRHEVSEGTVRGAKNFSRFYRREVVAHEPAKTKTWIKSPSDALLSRLASDSASPRAGAPGAAGSARAASSQSAQGQRAVLDPVLVAVNPNGGDCDDDERADAASASSDGRPPAPPQATVLVSPRAGGVPTPPRLRQAMRPFGSAMKDVVRGMRRGDKNSRSVEALSLVSAAESPAEHARQRKRDLDAVGVSVRGGSQWMAISDAAHTRSGQSRPTPEYGIQTERSIGRNIAPLKSRNDFVDAPAGAREEAMVAKG